MCLDCGGTWGTWRLPTTAWRQALETGPASERAHVEALRTCRSAWRATFYLLPNDAPPVAFHTGIAALGRAERWLAALALVEHLPTRRPSPSFSATTALPWHHALQLLHHLRHRRLRATCKAFSACLASRAAARGRPTPWRWALSVSTELPRLRVLLDPAALGTVVQSLATFSQWRKAQMLLNCCWRLVNVATLNAAVSACERVAAWPQALCYADPSGLVLPDIITYNTALSACGNGGKLQQVVNLMAKMRRVVRLDARFVRFVPEDAITYTAAISTCEKRLHWQGSVGFLDEMRDAHLRANEKGEQWLRAFSLFSTVAPSVITYNGCLSATAKVQLWRAALDLLQLNPRPSLISFNTRRTTEIAMPVPEHFDAWSRARRGVSEPFQAIIDQLVQQHLTEIGVVDRPEVHEASFASPFGSPVEKVGTMTSVESVLGNRTNWTNAERYRMEASKSGSMASLQSSHSMAKKFRTHCMEARRPLEETSDR
eukprot:g243.t1